MEQKDFQEQKVSCAAVSTTVAVTGANGFIAAHIVKLLLSKGYTVHGTVRDPSNPAKVDHLKCLPKAAENLKMFKADLLSEGCFDEAFKGCHCVFHAASPLLHQTDDPENELIKPALFGTLNVLKSCERVGVKVVIQTSSMSAVAPQPEPRIKNETHWSDPEEQKKRGSWYGASKTLAERAVVEYLAKMTADSAFRLARICPTFVVGPMLQPKVNLTMGAFAGFAKGTGKEIKNDSMSFIDVRDCAAHHVAAYEGGHEGRFMSLVESWPWTVIYAALKHCHPEMITPKPFEAGTKPKRASQHDSTRMKSLGVNERSMMQLIRESVDVCRERGLLK